MLNYIWGAMILIGVVYAMITGNMEGLTSGMLDSSKEAVNVCMVMLGVVSLWTGLMKIAQNCGIIGAMTRKIAPLIHFLFPGIPKGHKSLEYISTNVIANIMGLGWAATPAGLKAMEELAHLEKERGNPSYIKGVREKGARVASSEMCTFLVLNISSLQLIPVNMIAYRSQYGSANPAAVLGPGLVATMVSTLVAVVLCKMMSGRKGGFGKGR